MSNYYWKKWVLAAAALLVLPFAATAQTEFQREYTQEAPLVYEDAWDLWPYVFLDDQGEPTGYNVELLKLIFEELNIPYVIHLKPTQQALEDLRSGKADLMLGMVANFHDDYTMHYGKNVIHLFTHSIAHPKNESPAVHTVEDLALQKVIVHTGSFSHHLMQDRGWGANATGYNDMDKAIQMVSAERHGQVLWNTMSLKWLINKYHADNLQLTPVDMPSGDYRFMANDERLLKQLDDKYAELAASNRLQALQTKWFHPEEDFEEPTPAWVWYLIASMALLALLLIVISLIYHVRERKATHETRLRNARLALILKTFSVRIWTYNVHNKTFTWHGDSGNAERRFSEEEFSHRYHPEDFRRLKAAIASVASGKQQELQLELNAKDGANGEERSYNINLKVLRKEKGRPSVIIGTKADITEVHERQQRTEELTRRYEDVFSTAMVDMVYYDEDGYIANMNQRAQQTFHMNLQDTLKEHVNIRDLIGAYEFNFDVFGNNEERYNATLFLNTPTENRNIKSRKLKNVMYYELQVVPVYNEEHKLLGAYGTGRDVTEVAETYSRAKETVSQLGKATEAVTAHVDNINYAMQVGGVRMVTYTPKTHMMAIYHRMHEAQYVLTQQRCLQLTSRESERQVMRLFRAMDRHADMTMNCDVKTNLRLSDGKILCLQLQLFPTRDNNGNIVRYSGICRDTTEMMHTEMLLMQETEKAQEIEQVKNKFLHNMCYEIRTPLNIVVGFAEMFEKDHSPEEEEVFIDEIKKNSAYLLDLINDILFLSRLDAKMVEINPQPCDFSQTFEGHCHMGWAHKQREGVKYVVENQYSQLVVNIDDANIGRIIQQVITNAVEHTTQGTVRARYEYIAGRLVIAVDDTGEGIAPSKLEHIFERFNTSANANQGGTGLGMPICKELITQLGGTIEVNSEMGKGTSVWISLPCEAITVEHKIEK